MKWTILAALAAVGLCAQAAWAEAAHPPSLQLSKLLEAKSSPTAHTVTSSMSPRVAAAYLPPPPRPQWLASVRIPAAVPISVEPARAVIPAPPPKPLDLARRARLWADLHSDDWLATQTTATGGAEWECLAQALYFEARSERAEGQFGVAEVILNRVDSARYPDTVCDVINQGTGRKYACQFTYTCDGLPETIKEPRAWERVGKVARVMLDGAPRSLTDGALFYHTDYVSPSWSLTKVRTNTIGGHHFYR